MRADDEVLLGKHAVRMGFLTETQLAQVLALQQKLGGRKRMGELLVAKGFISAEQLARLIKSHEEALRKPAPPGTEGSDAENRKRENVGHSGLAVFCFLRLTLTPLRCINSTNFKNIFIESGFLSTPQESA